MPTSTPRIKFVDDPSPLGDMPLAPAAATGRSEAELARAMVGRLYAAARRSRAKASGRGTLAALLRRAAAMAHL